MEKNVEKRFSCGFIRVLKVNFRDQNLFLKKIFYAIKTRINSLAKSLFL
jgi:transcriptional regulator CtsR